MKSIAEKIANYFVELEFEDLPSEVIEISKMCILDLVGVSLRASILEPSKILVKYIKEIGGKKESTVMGYSFKTSCANAGLVNGAIGHTLQMDDGEMTSIGHLNCVIIPAALAVGEKENISGKEFITSIVAGNEGSIRIGDAVNPSHNRRGFSPNGTIGVFGAAISAGKILNLDNNAMTDAITSAAMQSAGLEQFVHDGSMSTFLNTGHACQAGIQSALLAEKGFNGSHEILEGRKGFCRAYSDNYTLKKIEEGLGEDYRILNIYFKFYPTCRYIHPATDAILNIVQEREIDPSEIKEVIIKTYPVVINTVDNPNPTTEFAATLSMQYAISAAIVHKRSSPDEFYGNKMNKNEIKKLMSKIKLIDGSEELKKISEEPSGVILKLKMKNGEEIEEIVQKCKGDPGNFTKDDLIRKFKELTLEVLEEKKIEKIINVIEKIENLKNIKKFAELLSIDKNKRNF